VRQCGRKRRRVNSALSAQRPHKLSLRTENQEFCPPGSTSINAEAQRGNESCAEERIRRSKWCSRIHSIPLRSSPSTSASLRLKMTARTEWLRVSALPRARRRGIRFPPSAPPWSHTSVGKFFLRAGGRDPACSAAPRIRRTCRRSCRRCPRWAGSALHYRRLEKGWDARGGDGGLLTIRISD
jgi:hypothetical protein